MSDKAFARDFGPADPEIPCPWRYALQESRAESSSSQAALLRLSRVRSFPLYTEWKRQVGFPPFGEIPKINAARNTTA